jgi:hypothetical protein
MGYNWIMLTSPENPNTHSPRTFEIKRKITIGDLPTNNIGTPIYPRAQVEAILALKGKLINPFETLRIFEEYRDNPISEEHMTRLIPRLRADIHLGLKRARNGREMMPANKYCRFLLAVAITVPFPSQISEALRLEEAT